MKKLIVLITALSAINTFALADGDMEPIATPSAVAVSDNNGLYLGLAYGRGKLREDYNAVENGGYNVYNEIQKINYDNIMLQAGYKFNKYLSFEGRYWKSFGDNGWSYTESGYTAGVPYSNSASGFNGDNMKAWGIYVKPMYPITKKTDIYALLGYGNITLNDNDNGNWLDENRFQWGIGASYAFEKNFSLFLDYVRLVDKDYSNHIGVQIGGSQYNWNDTLYTLNVGLTYRF
ncbi:MAG: outer membrane beta-barrel protein [Sulfurovaceae bacterium]|nr:outer membrane beta-barrel protein [Sulfurovaceae bacterium]